MQVYNDEQLYHHGVIGMKWGHHSIKTTVPNQHISRRLEKTVYAIGAKINPRELKYKVRKVTNKVNDHIKTLADLTEQSVKQTGVLPANRNALKAIESVGITAHKNAVYNNLDHKDLQNLKTYTDSSRYSRSVNGYLAIGDPKAYAKEAEKLKQTLRKNAVINCKKCPGVLADGKTSDGKPLVNTRSNQEGILAPNKLTYRKMEFDKKRGMFAITVDAS